MQTPVYSKKDTESCCVAVWWNPVGPADCEQAGLYSSRNTLASLCPELPQCSTTENKENRGPAHPSLAFINVRKLLSLLGRTRWASPEWSGGWWIGSRYGILANSVDSHCHQRLACASACSGAGRAPVCHWRNTLSRQLSSLSSVSRKSNAC